MIELAALAGVAACLAALVALRVLGDPERKRARRILAAAVPLVAEAARDGDVVRVTGVVRVLAEGERFVSPLSETRCVAYRVRVSARRGQFAYAALHEAARARAFVLERAEGPPVIVDGAHLVFDLPPARLGRSLTRRLELLRAIDMDDANAAQSSFEEVVVEVGATITVAGTLARVVADAPAGERLYRDGAGVVLRIAGDAAHPIAIGGAVTA